MNSKVQYDHARGCHDNQSAKAAFEHLVTEYRFSSLLDVGAGTGSWLLAALEFGLTDVVGVDGTSADGRAVVAPSKLFLQLDLESPFDLGRQFDAALCLEVGEHLVESAAPILVDSLCRHSSVVAFSAACPGQVGQNHINCQWPEYWQALFNDRGYACDDHIRFLMWTDPRVEPWYRQNMFVAKRDPARAGTESRLRAIIHPEMTTHIHSLATHETRLRSARQARWRAARSYVRAIRNSVFRMAERDRLGG